MRFVNTKGLRCIGSGVFASVYRLSPTRIIKVYDYDPQHDGNLMAEEIELSMCSEHALPILDVAIAKKRGKRYYAVIKEYLPKRATYLEAIRLEKILPRRLQLDCHEENVRKNKKGKMFLIDTQGRYAFKVLGFRI